MDFGEKLRKARKGSGLGLREMAALRGTGFTSLGEYERGESMPSSAKARRIADAYGVAGHWGCSVVSWCTSCTQYTRPFGEESSSNLRPPAAPFRAVGVKGAAPRAIIGPLAGLCGGLWRSW